MILLCYNVITTTDSTISPHVPDQMGLNYLRLQGCIGSREYKLENYDSSHVVHFCTHVVLFCLSLYAVRNGNSGVGRVNGS